MSPLRPLYDTFGRTAFYAGFSYFVVACVQSVWQSTFQHYAISMYQITPVQMGVATSLISIPGFLSVAIGMIGMKMTLRALLALSFIFIGLGMIGASLSASSALVVNTGWITNWNLLLICVLLLHVGFVMYYPTIHAIFLMGVDSFDVVKRLSSLKSLWPLAGVVVPAMIIPLLSSLTYASILAIAGGSVFLAGALSVGCITFDRHADRQHRPRITKALLPYYLLNFLNGSRSAIFKTFVVYFLIDEYQFEKEILAIILLFGNLLTFVGYQWIGRLAKYINPARLLGWIYIIMCLNFFGFMVLASTKGLILVYMLDSLVFCTSAITDSYLKFLSKDRALLSDLSAGVSLYHLGKVIMPVVAGLLYASNVAHAFFLGSICTLLSYGASKMLGWQYTYGNAGKPLRI